MRSRGPTKRCITLPGVNKPRGRGLARGSPLRLRLLLRLCISSAAPPPRSLSSTSCRPQYSFFLLPSTLCVSLARSRAFASFLSLSFFPAARLYEDRKHRWLVGHPQIIFRRENSSRRSTAIAIFSNLSLPISPSLASLPLLITPGGNARNHTRGARERWESRREKNASPVALSWPIRNYRN